MLCSASLLKPRTARQKESVIDSHYNIGDRTGAGLLAAAEADGVVFSPWHPTTVADQAGTASRQADVLAPVRDRHHATVAQLAIAWLLHRSPVMLPIPGTSARITSRTTSPVPQSASPAQKCMPSPTSSPKRPPTHQIPGHGHGSFRRLTKSSQVWRGLPKACSETASVRLLIARHT
jgi:hypothetical protein